jgi:hypothetical protein
MFRPLDLEENIYSLAGGETAYLNNADIQEQFFKIGQENFVKKGRGVVVVDLRRFVEKVVRIYYLSAGKSNGLPNQWNDQEMDEVCHSYDPEREVIVFALYGEHSPRNECYKLAIN